MLAIVIPYYKFDFFEDTLRSLAQQTNKNFNVYIGDDSSPVPPKALLLKYEDKINIKYKRFSENSGAKSLPKQWERCLEMVQNEPWIQVLGDDDVLGTTCVKEFYDHLNILKNNETKVVRFASQVINENGENVSKRHTHPEQERAMDFFMRKSKGGTRSSLSEYVFEKNKLVSIGFRNFPLAWHSDEAAVFEVAGATPIYTLNKATVYFRHSKQNITGKKDNSYPKAEASFLYYHFLLKRYAPVFSKGQTDFLYKKWEKAFLSIKSRPDFWIKFSYFYFKNARFIPYFQFLKRIRTPFKKPTNIPKT